jgi:uncharacterized protein (TIGR02679 family)
VWETTRHSSSMTVTADLDTTLAEGEGSVACTLCDGTCRLGDLDTWIGEDTAWFWARVARLGDARINPSLLDGSFYVTAPADLSERAKLLLGGYLPAGESRKIDLTDVVPVVAPLTPGAIAAHAMDRVLGEKRRAKALRVKAIVDLRTKLEEMFGINADQWARIQRMGWPGRGAELLEPGLLEQVAKVMAALPGKDAPIDRRRLAQEVLGNPHALDRRRVVSTFCLAMLQVTERVSSNLTALEAWRSVGMLMDGIVDGISVTGITPLGITVAEGMCVTVPTRVLATAQWEKGSGDVFVTENPSVMEAALEVPGARVLCTLGTPTKEALEALGRLAEAGWKLHVRADFDTTGLSHVRSILEAAPSGVAWRMSVEDYLAGVVENGPVLRYGKELITPWEPALAVVMMETGQVVNEEALLDEMLEDIAGAGRGR